jgi:hypothetical protein
MGIRGTLVALSILASAGCGARLIPAGSEPVYFPMEANRIWEYRLRDLGRDHAWPVSVRSRGPQFVPELGRVVAIFDEEYPDQVVPVAFFLSEGFLQSEIRLGYGLEDRMGVLPIGSQPMRVMPDPPTVGARWSYSEDVFGGSGGQLDRGFAIQWTGIVTGRETVEVPAGVFRDCLRVESTAAHRTPAGEGARQYRYVDWYGPGVGLVRSEYSFSSTGKILTRMELVRYRLAPQPPVPGATNMRMARAEW